MFGPGRRVARRTARRTSRRVSRRQAMMRGAYEDTVAQQPASPPPQEELTASQQQDYAVELQKLAQLKEQGILSEAEFEAKKKQILGI